MAPESVALLPAVSKVPPAACSTIGRPLAILAPANCRVPPANTGPAAPVGPDASVQASAPDACAVNVRPEASSALPLEQMRGKIGREPTAIVPTTEFVVVSMTETLLVELFAT